MKNKQLVYKKDNLLIIENENAWSKKGDERQNTEIPVPTRMECVE